ncbi:MAG: hypothetical protein NTZ56_14705 [Acidobacteria bacterium]|nr:hypothetical protein [Acidobacteriota bacterium]
MSTFFVRPRAFVHPCAPFFALFIAGGLCVPAQTTSSSDPYEVTLRLPEGGLSARQEMHLEVSVRDPRKSDPVMGAMPVVHAQLNAVIDMPSMAGMPKIAELAHPEGIPGDYGLHPVFVHGGTFRMRLGITPPGQPEFTREFALEVGDARPLSGKQTPSYKLEMEGKQDDLTFKIISLKELEKGQVKEFDIAHEKKLHLIAIRRDRQVFLHLHPEPSADGSFRLQFAWPAGGDYMLFADTAPRGKGSQVTTGKLKVKGPSAAPPAVSPLKLTVGPLPKVGRTGVLELKLTPALPLEPYLGAMGHLIILHEDGETLVHSHPADESSAEKFLVRLPKAGKYQAWLEVQSGGKVIPTAFALEAQ